ncbi:SpoIVB peptidase S55 domain-containing protein [Lysinibacillus sp. 3P01SB]|uniref:SpoIVB peptidase S55 domain-containing protein n=1 Tax=Lysinibacillus sp. 3P01SB TaxID=3132284 RepID=UPI0039A707EB
MKKKLIHYVVLIWLMVFTFAIPIEAKKLIPMGNTISVQLEMPHYYVLNDVLLDSGEWLRKRDQILKIDGQEVRELSEEDPPSKDAKMLVKRGGKEHTIQISGSELQHLTSFIKNETDGIGTLTYIDPDDMEYGALGHQIIDHSLDIKPKVMKGSLYLANISQIKKSRPGEPGYKISSSERHEAQVGSILENEVYGIFGKWQQPLKQSLYPPLEIIHGKEIKTGPAQMVTSIEGATIEKFDINIHKVTGETFQFTVTDERLLEKTGGIIQGMSGSPIVQNEQFVGAVTHMFVEEPTKGAAITIVEMIKKSPE